MTTKILQLSLEVNVNKNKNNYNVLFIYNVYFQDFYSRKICFEFLHYFSRIIYYEKYYKIFNF